MDIDFKKIAQYSKPGPRYTSYPTANEFNQDFDEYTLGQCLIRSNNEHRDTPLSIYIHMPFCESVCYFCGCNVIYTNSEDKKERYISYLEKEMELIKRYVDCSREVVQFHFGGGTPTFFDASQLDSVMRLVRECFTNFSHNAEISCEVDPRHFNDDQMRVLHKYGFNRISFGVQDFESSVQSAINRVQSIDLIQRGIDMARRYGIRSINFDLIYGLPHQNEDTFINTLQKVVSLDPDRLAVFNYAHVPWVKKTMRKIKEDTLPEPEVKLRILQNTIRFLESEGYEMIGMDHFAKRNDELYVSKLQGTLRRNFQGYTTKGFSQTIGIGITSISEGVDFYSQNLKDIKSYEERVDQGRLPVGIGKLLSRENILRKHIIMNLMSNAHIDLVSVQERFGIDFMSHFADEVQAMEEFEQIGVLEIGKESIRVNRKGTMLIRNIAMIFDEYLAHNRQRQFSKTI